MNKRILQYLFFQRRLSHGLENLKLRPTCVPTSMHAVYIIDLGGPMTRSRARKAKEALQQVLFILFEYKPKFQGKKSKVVSCIIAQMEED